MRVGGKKLSVKGMNEMLEGSESQRLGGSMGAVAIVLKILGASEGENLKEDAGWGPGAGRRNSKDKCFLNQ